MADDAVIAALPALNSCPKPSSLTYVKRRIVCLLAGLLAVAALAVVIRSRLGHRTLDERSYGPARTYATSAHRHHGSLHRDVQRRGRPVDLMAGHPNSSPRVSSYGSWCRTTSVPLSAPFAAVHGISKTNGAAL